ncbi:MAG TPA: hypothetical protein ENF55_03795 [Thermoprotei archaeon]|nr:MAG: hypothetical protein DRJ63_06155 [Thermoprotei archaeon]HDI75059.1 hypothetical protein [Thermoprotei archaeon]
MKKLLFIGLDSALTYFIEKFTEEKVMLFTARLMENGCYFKALPSPPTDTPTNWATLMTGCWAGTHGLTSFNVHLPGDPLIKRYSTLNSKLCQVKFLWDLLEEYGYRCVVVNYPVAWPSTLKRGVVIGGPAPLGSHWRIGFSKCFATKTLKGKYSPPTLKIEFKESRNPVLVEKSEIKPLEAEVDLFMQLNRDKIHYTVKRTPKYTLGLIGEKEYEKAVLLKGDKILAELKEGEWSQWIIDIIETDKGETRAAIKVKLVRLAGDAGDVRFYCTDFFDTRGWSYPEKLADEIVEKIGPYTEGFEHPGMHEDLGYVSWLEDNYSTLLEQAKMQAEWFTKVAKYLKDKEKWDAFIMHFHLPDGLNHWLLGYLHPEHPLYSRERAEIAMRVYREGYRIMDYMIEKIVSLVDLGETVVVIASDHGSMPHWKFVNLLPALIKRGLIAYKWDSEESCYIVDWSRTKVFPYFEPSYIWVNLKSKYPHGSVEDSEYDEIVEETIKALYSIRDFETGECPIAVALRKEDAVYLGQWGDRVGDIVYFLKPSYSCWNTPRFDKISAEVMCLPEVAPVSTRPTNVTGYHSTYLPNARIGVFEIPAPIIVAGKGFKKGYRRPKPAFMTDIAPTILHALGLEVPDYMEGKVLRDLLI